MIRSLRISFLLSCMLMSMVWAQNGLDFDGTNDYIQTTYGGVSGNGARTIEAWIKTTANANPSNGGVQNVIVDWGTFATGARFTFCVLWNNAIRLEVSGSGLSGTIAVNDGMWHHVAGVYDPNATNKFALYVDGVLDTTDNIITTVNTGSLNDMVIGRRIDNVRYFDGTIDEVRVWNVARSQSDIQGDMNQELCSPSGLTAYYKLNHGTAGSNNTGVTTAVDFSAGSNNGTLLNFSLSGTSSNWVTGASLTPGNGGSDSITVSSCDAYTSPSGKTWTSSNVYLDTVQNAVGCDSVIQVDLTILESTYDTIAPTACDSYLSPSGNYLWGQSGVYQDTLPNLAGCDSVITINLTINNQTNGVLSASACESYTSPSGNQTWTASGTYQDIIPNSQGCDSIITIFLTITGNTNSTSSTTACDSYTSPSGKLWTNSGTFLDTIPNAAGCDSIMIINLTINNSINSSLTETGCDSFISPSGKYTWTTSGMYQDTLVQSNGCPEYVSINLTVISLDTGVTQNGFELTAQATGVSYQWLDCDQGWAPIPGATQQSYTPTVSGTYAVMLSDQSCQDTSACVAVLGVGIADHNFGPDFTVYPNPSQGQQWIELGRSYRDIQVKCWDLQGRNVQQMHWEQGERLQVDLLGLAPGIYLCELETEGKQVRWKVEIR